MKILVVGSGGWGTALSLRLLANGHEVTLWSYHEKEREVLETTRKNPLLAGVTLPQTLRLTNDAAAATDAETVVFATPSFAVRATAKTFAPHLREDALLVSVTKGIEDGSGCRMSQIITQETGKTVVALSGPSHAEEVSRGLPTGVVAACEDRALAERVQNVFMSDCLRVYTCPDVIGVAK